METFRRLTQISLTIEKIFRSLTKPILSMIKSKFLASVPRNLSTEVSKIFGQFLLFGDNGKRKDISCW